MKKTWLQLKKTQYTVLFTIKFWDFSTKIQRLAIQFFHFARSWRQSYKNYFIFKRHNVTSILWWQINYFQYVYRDFTNVLKKIVLYWLLQLNLIGLTPGNLEYKRWPFLSFPKKSLCFSRLFWLLILQGFINVIRKHSFRLNN